MSRGARLGLIAAAIAVAVVAFLIARPGGDDDDANDGASRAETTTQTDSRPARPPQPQAERIQVRDGEPVGGVRELRVDRGDRVRFVVTADVSERVHVHGYDLFEDVAPGRPARFDFEADIDGIFEIELEDSHTPIAELRVEP